MLSHQGLIPEDDRDSGKNFFENIIEGDVSGTYSGRRQRFREKLFLSKGIGLRWDSNERDSFWERLGSFFHSGKRQRFIPGKILVRPISSLVRFTTTCCTRQSMSNYPENGHPTAKKKNIFPLCVHDFVCTTTTTNYQCAL